MKNQNQQSNKRPPPRRPPCGTRINPTLLELVEILQSRNADNLLQEGDIYECFPFEIINEDTPKIEDKEEYLIHSEMHFSKENMVRRTLANGFAYWKMNDQLSCIANEAAVLLGTVKHFTLTFGARPCKKKEEIKSQWRLTEITLVGGDGKSSIAILKDCNTEVKKCSANLQKAKKILLDKATSLALALMTKDKDKNKNNKNKEVASVNNDCMESRKEVEKATEQVQIAEEKLREAKRAARAQDWAHVETVKSRKKKNSQDGGNETSVDGSLGGNEEANNAHYTRVYTENVLSADQVETRQASLNVDPILEAATQLLFSEVANQIHSSQSRNSGEKSRVKIVILGHADSGKSTIAGHLLYKTGAIGKNVIDDCERDANFMKKGSLKYAWVMDKSVEERERGITIDIGEASFQTHHYLFEVLDAPGQRDYIGNVVSGTLRADCALLVLDSRLGSFEAGLAIDGQTREHMLLAYTLGVKRMICCCNKMDGIERNQETRYYEIVRKMKACLSMIGYEPREVEFVPVSGYEGDNLIDKSMTMDWYTGPTLLEALQKLNSPMELVQKPLRLPLHEIYDTQDIGTVAVGRVETGFVREGMVLRFAPTGSPAIVSHLARSGCSEKVFEAMAGDSVVFRAIRVDRQDDVNDLTSGIVAYDAAETSTPAMSATSSFTAQVFVVNHPGKIEIGYTPQVECHFSTVPVKFDKFIAKINPQSGSEGENEPQYLMNGDIGVVRMVPALPMVVEAFAEFPPLGRFVVRHREEVVLVGIVKTVVKENPD